MKKLIIGALIAGFTLFVTVPAMACWNCDNRKYYTTYEGDTINQGGKGGEGGKGGTGIGVGIGGGADVDVKNKNINKNKNKNTNTNVNTNWNHNNNVNKNTNVNLNANKNVNKNKNINDIDINNKNKQKQDQNQKQGQAQAQGQLQGQAQGQMNNWTQIFEDKREFVGTADHKSPEISHTYFKKVDDADVMWAKTVLDVLAPYDMQYGHWLEMAQHGKFKRTVVRTMWSRKVDPGVEDELIEGKAKWLAGFVTVKAKKDHTNAVQVIAEAMKIAHEIGGTHYVVMREGSHEFAKAFGWSAGLAGVAAENGSDSGGSISGGPGISSMTSGRQQYPHITLMVTHN